MCGIIFAVSRFDSFRLPSDVLSTLEKRGPDSLSEHTEKVKTKHGHLRYLTFAASVLSLRGSEVQHQPLIDLSTGAVLCWNGEAWRIRDKDVQGNDSQIVLQELTSVLASIGVEEIDIPVRSKAISTVLTLVAGPFATLFFDAPTSHVYFARDRLGRRSLLMSSKPTTTSDHLNVEFALSSFDLTAECSMTEVPTTGVHRLDLRSPTIVAELLPWQAETPILNKDHPAQEINIPKGPSTESISALGRNLISSIKCRILDIPTCNAASDTSSPSSRLAILFSGGLDCTLLARICHDVLANNQSIDLLNVAFENPRTVKAAHAARNSAEHAQASPYETCPDRITGRSSFSELVKICPHRVWRFVAIDIPYTEMLEHRSTIIQLMQPHNTEMDLSIAMALYFAAKGKGHIQSPSTGTVQEYITSARVLLSGLGADELFGGYSRHAAAFSRNGFTSLNEELELDFTRIGSRNLGRDDRVTAHWSREVRYPYLDEDFVQFALALPAWEKVGFRSGNKIAKHFENSAVSVAADSMEALDPAKMILRCLMWQLGMKHAASEKKRAIQFGARTAKMHGGRTKGTDVIN